MIIFIVDGLCLCYGYFETKTEHSHYEITRGYNIFGDVLYKETAVLNQYRRLRMGDGITTFKTLIDMNNYLSKVGPYKMFAADLIHKKFYIDRDTLRS
jgi:hypothetical protein